MALPFWSISKCSQRMSPTKSGAKSRKRSFPIAHRVAPFIQNLSKSTFFRLNSFTVHVSHSATWFSVHCLGSEEDHGCYIHQFLCRVFRQRCTYHTYIQTSISTDWYNNSDYSYSTTILHRILYCAPLSQSERRSFVVPPTIKPPLW